MNSAFIDDALQCENLVPKAHVPTVGERMRAEFALNVKEQRERSISKMQCACDGSNRQFIRHRFQHNSVQLSLAFALLRFALCTDVSD